MSDTILLLRDGAIATVVLNRPEKLNALTKPMWQRLGEVFDELSADDAIRCIVIRGAGTKSFAPGNDISEFENERSNVEQARAYGRIMHRTIDSIANCRHPVVAMIHGICVGGGLEIAGLADIRICGESSRFGAPIKNLGLVMAYGEIGVGAWLNDQPIRAHVGAQHCRRRTPGGPLAQEVRAAAGRPDPSHGRGIRRGIRLFRHGGLQDRLSGLSRQGEAGFPGTLRQGGRPHGSVKILPSCFAPMRPR